MNTAIKRLFDCLLRDKDGHVVVGQFPNLPLIGWFLFMIVANFIPAGWAKHGLENLSTAFLFVWAYLEITQGSSLLRRLLGVAVIATVLQGYFR